MYLIIKHLHIVCVVLSGLGFFARGVLMLRDSPRLQSRWLKTLPHVNDALLLTAAIALVVMSGQYPFVVAWVTAKVLALMVYILLGALALGRARTKPGRLGCWLLALLCFAYIVSVALSRDPLGFFSLLTQAAVVG